MAVEQPFLPFALPEIGEAEIAEVVDTLRSGWLTTGPKTKRFEDDFTAFLGDPSLQSLAVNSATAGLHLALEALGIGPGDEVITTTHTFTATAEVVRYLGADVKLVDIDAATLCIDPNEIERAVSAKTKAIIPVHYGGLAADMSAILDIARRHGLKVVEDAAHALPATSEGRLVGTLGSDATVFSFYANKTITTGEGGMVVTRNPKLAARMKTMRLHGMSRDAFDRFTAKVPSWYYEIVAPGFKYNLTDIAAAIGHPSAERARRVPAAARGNRRGLRRRRFADLPVELPPRCRPRTSSTPGTSMRLRLAEASPVGRDALIERLFAGGIGCSVHYIPLHLQPYWRDRYALDAQSFPHSQHAYERMLSLPIYPRMTDADVDRVVAAVAVGVGVTRPLIDRMTKRLLDVAFSAGGLLLLSPVLVAIAAWVRLDSPGPALYRQERVGRDGASFRIHKFRTMRNEPASAERQHHDRCRSSGHARRPLSSPQQARRAAAADRRAVRRHESRRASPRSAALRGHVSGRDPGQGAQRAARHHRPGVAAVSQRERACSHARPTRSASIARWCFPPSCVWPSTTSITPPWRGDLRLLGLDASRTGHVPVTAP